MKISAKALAATVGLIRPPERLKISGWAEKDARIPEEGNAEPGKYRLSRMPHQAEMLDDPLDPDVREIYWMMASQAAGKTLCLILICEYVIKVLRKSLLMVRATKDTALEWMRDKFMPTIEATPAMAGLLKDPREKGGGSTALKRRFPGGSLKVAGAKSPATLRGSSQGKIFQDEVDSYEVTKEGDPCALADRAAITFSDSWKIKCSTPTIVGFSRIDNGFERGDKRYYFVPCLCCGEFQPLETEQMKFSFTAEEHARFQEAAASGVAALPGSTKEDDKGSRQSEEAATAAVANGFAWEIGDFEIRDTRRCIYVCRKCHRGWTDTQRVQAILSGHPDNPPVVVNGPQRSGGPTLADGPHGVTGPTELRAHWRATAPFTGIRSRHLNGMYLTIGLKKGMANYLHQFAEDFLEAKRGGRETLMVWTNIFKTIAYEDAHEKLDWKDLKERAEDYWASAEGGELPVQVVWIAFGADIQPDRVELLFWGWGVGEETWALERHVEYGDFDMPSMQERVREYLLNKRFKHPVLGDLPISAGAFDSGHQTKVKAVYQFCARHSLQNWWSVKGFDSALGAVYQVAKEKVYGGRRFNLNVDYFKTTLFDRLKNKEPGARYVHFPKEEVEVELTEGRGQRAEDSKQEGTAASGVAALPPKKARVKTGFDKRFYQQLCSEKRLVVKVGNGFELRWVKLTSSTRNEVLDMTVYAFGVFEVCRQVEWIARKWKEVQKVLQEKRQSGPGPAGADGSRDYILNSPEGAVTEKKIPDVMPEKKVATVPPRPPGRRRIRINSPFGKKWG